MFEVSKNVRIEATSDTLEVGMFTTCQMGNRSDSCGYREEVVVEILAISDNLAGRSFFVKEMGQDFYGAASIYSLPTKGILYCTNARRVGNFGDCKNELAAKRSLGF